MNRKAMKAIKFFVLLILSIALFNCGQNNAPAAAELSENDKKEILQVLTKQSADWNEGNLEKFMEGYWKSDSLQFIKRKKIVKGWEETLDNYKKTYGDSSETGMGKLQFEVMKLNPISGDAAFMTGRFNLERGKRKNSGIFTLVFRKVDGRWVIVYDHTT